MTYFFSDGLIAPVDLVLLGWGTAKRFYKVLVISFNQPTARGSLTAFTHSQVFKGRALRPKARSIPAIQ